MELKPKLACFLTNLGTYAAGSLDGAWLQLPTDRETLKSTFRTIGISEGGEYFITDYNCDAIPGLSECLGEYEDLDELNYLAAKVQEVAQNGDLELFSAALELGMDTGSVKDLINLTDNLDHYTLLPEVSDQETLGLYIVENGGYDLDALGKLANYINYDALGRDITIEEGGIFTEYGYAARDLGGISVYYESVEDIPQEYLVTSDMANNTVETMTEVATEMPMLT